MSNVNALHDINEFIRHLLSAIAGAALYTANHPQVHRLAQAAHTSLASALSERPDIALLEIEGELVIDGEPQPFSLVLDRFVQIMHEQGIGHLRFLAGASRTEVDQLIAQLARQSERTEIGSSEHIRLGRVEMPGQGQTGAEGASNAGGGSSGTAGGGTGTAARTTSLGEIPAIELARLSDVYEAIKRKERLKPSGIAETVTELVEAFRREGDALLILAALREQDEYTFTHAANVCILTLAQAMSLGISGQMLNDIGIAAMLHDIGKMFIPEEILTKPEKLCDDELEQMKAHPVLGSRYLMEAAGVPRLAAIVAFEHHLRYDQSGYPVVPVGWQQNVVSQMTAIADCFDAMRTRRPYQEPRSPELIATALLQGSGTEFNPLLVKNMLLILKRIKKI
ncbi:HD domain-containing protein [Trichlorobacter thiogenes]|uniref:HD domain-containing protein n=1 Tax=Trichlorobacter thiogenes TaxID=115783 RepID=A0A1T4R7T7_9BACT|nr:HD domain-containing phosphohydrolase [Trichlorobacter thiogenes]SKA11748.1 HD domain-containing protein [Trichlorobacter thiogenes]